MIAPFPRRISRSRFISIIKRQWSLAWTIALGALLAAVYFALPWVWLSHWESDTLDFRLHLRGVRRETAQVIVVGIADSSFTISERAPTLAAQKSVLARMGGKWPWDRRVFAAVLEKLTEAGARAIVLLIWSLPSETPGCAELALVLSRSRIPVVLAKKFSVHETIEGERSVTVLELRAGWGVNSMAMSRR